MQIDGYLNQRSYMKSVVDKLVITCENERVKISTNSSSKN